MSIERNNRSIDKYIFRVYDESKDYSLRDVINFYGLLCYFSLKPYLKEIKKHIASSLVQLLIQESSRLHYKREGYFLCFPDQNAFNLSLIELSPINFPNHSEDIELEQVDNALTRLFSYSWIEPYAKRLFAKKMTTGEIFKKDTARLFNKDRYARATDNHHSRKLLKRIWSEIYMNVTDIRSVVDDIYKEIADDYEHLNIVVNEIETLKNDLVSILPGFIFRVASEKKDYNLKELMSSLGVLVYFLYARVDRYSRNKFIKGLLIFAKEAKGENRIWKNYNCITTYGTITGLFSEFSEIMLSGRLGNILDYNRSINEDLYPFFILTNWMKIYPEFTLWMAENRGRGILIELPKCINLNTEISIRERQLGKSAFLSLVQDMESLTSIEIKSLINLLYKEACKSFVKNKECIRIPSQKYCINNVC